MDGHDDEYTSLRPYNFILSSMSLSDPIIDEDRLIDRYE